MSSDSITYAYTIRNSRYLNVTDRCTLACRFCPKQAGNHEVRGHDLNMRKPPDSQTLIAAMGDPLAYDEVVFCGYGEPTLRLEVILAVAAYVCERGGRVRLNTDGLANLVHKRNVLPEMRGLIHAVSISMNAQNETLYEKYCQPGVKGSYQAMLAFIALASAYIPEVTATAINGLPGVDVNDCREIAARLGADFRERQLDEVG
ncbi:MAG: TatD family nuclease-associated radical SAM protein [Gammaproteobacteria bacterium]|nr:TatD family nuclease-associated radical SAM protein [Gammaproteobacteria bacterium]